MKKIALLLLLTTFTVTSLTACSFEATLNELRYNSISDAANDVIDQALTLAEAISVDDIKQQYVDSGLKDAVDNLIDAIEYSYITYDYVIDTSSLKELYHGEDGGALSVFSDDSGKVYLVNYLTEETTVFTGNAATDFLYSYIEKASGLNLNNY